MKPVALRTFGSSQLYFIKHLELVISQNIQKFNKRHPFSAPSTLRKTFLFPNHNQNLFSRYFSIWHSKRLRRKEQAERDKEVEQKQLELRGRRFGLVLHISNYFTFKDRSVKLQMTQRSTAIFSTRVIYNTDIKYQGKNRHNSQTL